jgi:uncharacterized protein DUF1570
MLFAEDSGMKQGILAAALLAISAGFASADYVIIVANVAGGRELTAVANQGMAGMRGGPAGMMGGMQGGPPGGFRGGPPGGMQGGPPGGFRGGPPGGMQGGPPGGFRGGPPGGMQGGPPGGFRGGPPGAMMMGMRGGTMGGMMGMMGAGPTDVDDITDYVIAVVEVKAKGNLVKALLQRGLPVPVGLPSRLGKTCQLYHAPSFGELFVITEGKDKAMPTVADQFNQKYAALTKEKASGSDLLSLAEWALEHGMVNKFAEVMDKVVEADKGLSAAVAYAKVKKELDRKPADNPLAASLRNGGLLNGYRVTETPHYLMLHNSAGDSALEVQTHAEHLENAFRGFYYWFALRGIALTVPPNRQLVVLTNNEDNFEQFHKVLTSGPVVVDGFFARRESMAVMHSQRSDDPYKALSTYWENWKGKGYQRFQLLENKNTGVPKNGVPQTIRAQAMQDVTAQVNIAEAQMLALMLKALEQEAELATVSHEASRQLLFASGLLPRNVAVPEWILFGMGSFFETPLQSPWPTIGALSPYYLPRWRELKAKDSTQGGLEKTNVDTLKKVVTDGYFRSLPADGKADSAEHRVHEAARRKARTVTWSLTYFLAQRHLEGLRQYFAELSKMPRDIELDDTVLLGCFARALGCVDGNNKVDETKLKALANEWYGYWASQHFESEQIMKEIRDKIAKKMKEDEENAKKASEGTNGQQGPGNFPPGMTPQQGGPQQGRPPQGGPPQGPPAPPGANPPQRGPQQGGRGPQQGGRGVPPGQNPQPGNPGATPPAAPTPPRR